MAISADTVYTSARESVVKQVEAVIDEKLSDMDWVAENRHIDAHDREYWRIHVQHNCIALPEVEALAEKYKAAGWDRFAKEEGEGTASTFILYKKSLHK